MTIAKEPELQDALQTALDHERSLMARIAERSRALEAAKAAQTKYEKDYLLAAANAIGPSDERLVELRSLRQQSADEASFLEAALKGDHIELETVRAERYRLGQAKYVKTANRLTRQRLEAAERLSKAEAEYAQATLAFYESNAKIQAFDPTPDRALSKPGRLTGRGELSTLIEEELSRLNPVVPLDQYKRVVVPGQKVAATGNPRLYTPLVERIRASNAGILQLVANGCRPTDMES